MRMQFQIWIAGLAMGVDMKTRAQRMKKRGVKAPPASAKKIKQPAA